MKNATLRQLKVFECVARHLSFTRAAEELHLTQPAVSTQVKELEAHTGLPLFEQLGRKIYLTRAGEEMLHHSRAIIQQFREAEEAMQQLKGIAGGTLNVAVISAGDYFFPSVLAEFARRHPGVGLNLTVHNRAELMHQLADNLTDLAIMGRPPEDLDTVNEPFAPHPYVIVAAPEHPLAAKKRIPMAVLARGAAYYGFTGDVWTSPRVAQVIRERYGVHYHPGHVRHLLRQLGWSRQKPVRRASQRDEGAIRRWWAERWPALKKRRKRPVGRSSGSTRRACICCPRWWPPGPRAARRRSSPPR